MKNSSIYGKILLVCMCFLVVLSAIFLVSLKTAVEPVTKTPDNIPYVSDDAPDFFGALIRFSEAGSIYLAFDKAEEKTTVILLSNSATEAEVAEYGYRSDCIADANFDFLARFIDSFGGIELLNEGGETFKYTGVQITEMLSKTNDDTFKKTVISRLLNAMKNKGVERADLVSFIEQNKTNLNYPSVYYLHNTLNSSLSAISFVN